MAKHLVDIDERALMAAKAELGTRTLRLRGRKVPDLLIAAAAEGAALVVLHYEADFDLIARVTGQPCEWVVPAGSID